MVPGYKRGRPWLHSIFRGQAEKKREKRKILDIDVKIEEAVNSDRTKMVLEFNCQESVSIKSFAVKQSDHTLSLQPGFCLEKC